MTLEPGLSELDRAARRDLRTLVALAACCAAIPLALIATLGFATGRSWLVAAALVLPTALLVVYLAARRRAC